MRFERQLVKSAFAFVAVMALFGASANAEISCSKVPLAVMHNKIDAFLRRPESMLETYPRGDRDGDKKMEIDVRELIASDMNHTLDPMLKLLPQANAFQKLAIGSGLGNAAQKCNWAARPTDARHLKQVVWLTGNRSVFVAFMVAYSEAPIHPGLGSEAYVSPTNPLGRPLVSSPGTDVLKSGEKIRNPFSSSDPFAPMK